MAEEILKAAGTPADAMLFESVAARDSAALAELYDRHGRLLYCLIVRVVNDRGEAEEVLQDVFVQVWKHAGAYNAALGSPTAWLVGIARNRAIDRLRARAVRMRAVETIPEQPPVETPEASASVSERQRDVQRALEALPPGQRELIEQAYFLGLTQSELAARFGLPLGTVKTRIRTGLQALRGHLQRTCVQQ